jgi:hypothetical protein
MKKKEEVVVEAVPEEEVVVEAVPEEEVASIEEAIAPTEVNVEEVKNDVVALSGGSAPVLDSGIVISA